jgi:hypothetical protein
MSESPKNTPRKVKEKRQQPPDMTESVNYSHVMYGWTPNERRMLPKRVDHGASYLAHPKFQSLMEAFKKGQSFTFEITTNGVTCPVATDGTYITFKGRTLFYSRSLSKQEDNLYLDRKGVVQFQTQEPAVHLVFAVLRSLPELGDTRLRYHNRRFYQGMDDLETDAGDAGASLLLGTYRHMKPKDFLKK